MRRSVPTAVHSSFSFGRWTDARTLHQEFTPKGVLFKGGLEPTSSPSVGTVPAVRVGSKQVDTVNCNPGRPWSVLEKSGMVLLAMSQYVPPQTVPMTLVMEKQGRVAEREHPEGPSHQRHR